MSSRPVVVPPQVITAFQHLIDQFKLLGLPPALCADFLLDRAALLVVTCADGTLDDVKDAFIDAATTHFRANATKAMLLHAVPMGEA